MRRGFTLVELLTVIMIIGLVAGLSLAEISRSRARLRDNQRVSDLKLIETSLELYRVDLDRGAIANTTYPYPAKIYNDLTFSQYLTQTPHEPLTKKEYIYFAPGCLRPGKGTDDDPTVISSTKGGDKSFHSASEIMKKSQDSPYCPKAAGWLPYVLYAHLERPQATNTVKSNLVDLAGSDQAVVYSASQPIFRAGEAGSSSVEIIVGSSYCVPARSDLNCPDGYSQ